MPCRRSYNRLSNFLEIVDRYTSHIIVGIASLMIGAGLVSSCKDPVSVEKKELPPYPVVLEIYRVEDYNENKPFARAMMNDERTELLISDNEEGTSYTNIRVLEEMDIEDKKTDWILKRSDLESQIEAERSRITKEAESRSR